MSITKSSVKVTILGEEYAIRSDVPPDQTRAVAEYLDMAIKQVIRAGKVSDMNKAAILAALSITNELFEARREAQHVAASMTALSADIRKWLPPAKRGT